jgi:hypothetical protein
MPVAAVAMAWIISRRLLLICRGPIRQCLYSSRWVSRFLPVNLSPFLNAPMGLFLSPRSGVVIGCRASDLAGALSAAGCSAPVLGTEADKLPFPLPSLVISIVGYCYLAT